MTEILARYAFLPWMRQGLANQIQEEENFNDFSSTPPSGAWATGRPEVEVKAHITATKGSSTHEEDIVRTAEIIGPGDVIGLDQRVVVKHEPLARVVNFEPNYFPYIEFYEEDFLWRYSPAKAKNNKLRPWLNLIILAEGEYTRDETTTGVLPSITVLSDGTSSSGATSSAFPDPGKSWAWAHVHLNGDLDPTNSLDPTISGDLDTAMSRFRDLLEANPDQAVCRLMCPRQLDPNTSYTAFVIPAYETGRLAGLGADAVLVEAVETQRASYGADHNNDVDHEPYVDRFPIYYEWVFQTGDLGDFEYLVRQIIPRQVDDQVGKRPMDVQQPGFNIDYTGSTVPFDGTLDLEGALLAPDTGREAYPWTDSNLYRERLADYINLSEDLLLSTFPAGSHYINYLTSGGQTIEDDPIVTADLYGRWHALQKTVSTSGTGWVDELNLDPRNRAVAGLGVQYIKKNQESLMDDAWSQLGEVLEANRRIRWGQLAMQAAHRGYEKNIKSQPGEQVAALTSRLLKRVKVGSESAYKKVRESALPTAVTMPAFRKIERPAGPVMRRIDPGRSIFTQNTLRVDLANLSKKVSTVKTFSTTQAYLAVDDLSTDVETVVSHQTSLAVFGYTNPGQPAMAPDYRQEVMFTTALQPYDGFFEAVNWPNAAEGKALALSQVTDEVVATINPLVTIPRFIRAGFQFSKPQVSPPPDRIVPVMAYPVFHQPVYEAVKSLGQEFLIPNLNLIPDNTITILESNQRFIESFMVGLNHEMGRELLWREYPTDQRGSYFRQFWDSVDNINMSELSARGCGRKCPGYPGNPHLGEKYFIRRA